MEEKRCLGDPCYSMFFFPQRGELDRMINICVKEIKKKYSLKNNKICRIFGLLEIIDDDYPKILAMLFFMTWETKIQKMLEDAYNQTGIFEKNDKKHFKDFVIKMAEYVDKTIRFGYDKNNAIEIVTNFVDSAKIEYMFGPYHVIDPIEVSSANGQLGSTATRRIN